MRESRRTVLRFAVLLPGLRVPGCKAQPGGGTPPVRAAFRELERRVFELVNRRRSANGLAELKWNERLAQEARRHALNMAGRWFFAHEDPVRGDLAARLREDMIPWRRCAENIFQEQGYAKPAEQAVQSWLNSPGHRKNMFDPGVASTGVGVSVRADGTHFFVQVFTLP